MSESVCVCVRACVRACLRACVPACVRACLRVRARACVHAYGIERAYCSGVGVVRRT